MMMVASTRNVYRQSRWFHQIRQDTQTSVFRCQAN